jgi:hypothetical protein
MIAAAAASLAAMAGCAVNDASDARAHQPTTRGVQETDDAEVGYLRVLRTGGDRPAYYDWCTATLISPVVLLTAAHCMPRPGSTDTFDGFYTGPGAPSAQDVLPQNLTWHGVTEHAIYPGDSYHPGSYDYATDPARCPAQHVDLAVVRLAQPIDNVPLYSWQHHAGAFQGAPCTMIGYGYHEAPAGQKKQTRLSVRSTPDASWYTAPSSTGLVAWWDPGNSRNNGIPDHGDSGGPLICTTPSGPVIAGVASCASSEIDARAPRGTLTQAPIFEAAGEGPSVWIEYYWCTWTGYLCYV